MKNSVDEIDAPRYPESEKKMSKILIVDDDPALVDFLKLLLESEGYDTDDAMDGPSALARVQASIPDLVLLDYMMPNMDGLDVLKHVNTHHETAFVVMLTGKGSEEVAVECMKAGAVDYVVKPFDNDRLLSVIRNALRMRETELEKRKIMNDLQELNERLQKSLSALEATSRQWLDQLTHLDPLLNELERILVGKNEASPSADLTSALSLITRIRNTLGQGS